MISRITLVFSALVAVAMVLFGVTRTRLATEHVEARDRALRQAADEAQQILTLRSRAERVSARQRPTEDVIALVNRTLAETGAPSRRLTDLEQESDVVIDAGPPTLRRQTVRCTLQPVTLDELGRFLALWTRDQPLWTPVRIELSHDQRESDAVFTCRLALAAAYVGEP
jgi:hypothetical protein